MFLLFVYVSCMINRNLNTTACMYYFAVYIILFPPMSLKRYQSVVLKNQIPLARPRSRKDVREEGLSLF